MGNKISEKYFSHKGLCKEDQALKEEICNKTGFIPQEEIFRGYIYDTDKVGSLIYKGTWQGKAAVLKIQGLELEIDEADILERFNAQNKSTHVRVPMCYQKEHFDKEKGYGFLLSEYIDAPNIYTAPFSSKEEMNDFCTFFEEYQTKCLREPFIKKEKEEASAYQFTKKRIVHWQKIAMSKEHNAYQKEVTDFLDTYQKEIKEESTVFMHAHLTNKDIFKDKDSYILMSNLFWGYRPKWYDTTFHLWAGINAIDDTSIKKEQVIAYLQTWIESYKTKTSCTKDPLFEKRLHLLMGERVLGSLLVDIPNKNVDEEKKEHLRGIFQELYAWHRGEF